MLEMIESQNIHATPLRSSMSHGDRETQAMRYDRPLGKQPASGGMHHFCTSGGGHMASGRI
jgi:hypothetical protein